MSKEVAIALIGVVSSAFVAWITARLTWRLELQRWKRARDDVLTADLRNGLQQLILTIASSVHSMCWLTWLADTDPAKVTKARIDLYDDEMHKLLPQLLGQLALVASLRPQTYWIFKDLIDELFDADRSIGAAALRVVPGEPETVVSLSSLHERSLSIEDRIPEVVRSVLEDITRADESRFLKARPHRDGVDA
jgi:hypothetical protein